MQRAVSVDAASVSETAELVSGGEADGEAAGEEVDTAELALGGVVVTVASGCCGVVVAALVLLPCIIVAIVVSFAFGETQKLRKEHQSSLEGGNGVSTRSR